MPQMAPINWVFMTTLSMTLILLIFTTCYFTKILTLPPKATSFSSLTPLWKW